MEVVDEEGNVAVALGALLASTSALLLLSGPPASAGDEDRPPNILVIMGDDIGIGNISTYHQGILGYDPPGIDRLAKEGGKFTHYYAQQSCAAGRSAFITGQLPFYTGLSKVGLPGAELGVRGVTFFL